MQTQNTPTRTQNTPMRTCTYYRKDFSPEERVRYNKYVKDRMKVYHAKDEVKAKRTIYEKERYQKKKLERQQGIEILIV